ncbi:MAG: hypothetical protein KC543_09030, partial [Myxococcales bacterium]|nr:hypothetical protein [Myxococcales bacterium]
MARRRAHLWLLLVAVAAAPIASCARTPLADRLPAVDAGVSPMPVAERCNGVDDDLDGRVDEGFVDDQGRYVSDDHCGACDAPCTAASVGATEASCQLIADAPRCVATQCPGGTAPSSTGRCLSLLGALCLPCVDDADCGDSSAVRCAVVGGERRCVVGCELGCPDGYTCDGGSCLPSGGSCTCGPSDAFTVACALETPGGGRCTGQAVCDHGVLGACEGRDEVCNGVDDDCDGKVDEGFVDALGAYSVDVRNCGQCGVDCTTKLSPGGPLVCGGDPRSPSCVLHCPDLDDGLQVGDHVDADGDLANGCECVVSSLVDAPGPDGAVGSSLDVNCDGADGDARDGFYVSTAGDDAAVGSPSAPLRTIGEAVSRAQATLGGDPSARRLDVYVAAGTYTESVRLPDSVKLHGGYRADFRARSATGFQVVVRAPADTDAPGGAALVSLDAGARPTLAENVVFIGRDAVDPSQPAFGAVFVDPGPSLTLRGLTIVAGVGARGLPGADAAAGASSKPGESGDAPRAAVEGAVHQCLRTAANVAHGGRLGSNVCGGVDVSGGAGGQGGCPAFAERAGGGRSGHAAPGGGAGAGGQGGQGSGGPITGSDCPGGGVCCGLADFSVPNPFEGPSSGEPGAGGGPGQGGDACTDPLGRFDADV